VVTDAELRAEERGEMKADIKHLTNIVEVGFRAINTKVDNGFKSLDCTANTKKIDEMYIAHTDNKQIKQHIIKNITTQIIKASGLLLAGATVAYAYFK
jgi:hypothetical protein